MHNKYILIYFKKILKVFITILHFYIKMKIVGWCLVPCRCKVKEKYV